MSAKPLEPVAQHDAPTADGRMTERWRGCVSVIVPVYNEAAHLDELLQAIHGSPVKKEIIIVDDGSTDGTREKLRSLPPTDDVTVVFHEKNCGKGAAIRTALAYARGEYVLIQDSDLEYDPQDYPALLRPLEEGKANVVYGVRPDRPERGLRFFSWSQAADAPHQHSLPRRHSRRSDLLQSRPPLAPGTTATRLSSLRILPRSDREALPDWREDRRGTDLLSSALSRRREKNPPLRWMAGDLDFASLPLRSAPLLAAAGPRLTIGTLRGEFLAPAVWRQRREHGISCKIFSSLSDAASEGSLSRKCSRRFSSPIAAR